jgi:hypothetical protein
LERKYYNEGNRTDDEGKNKSPDRQFRIPPLDDKHTKRERGHCEEFQNTGHLTFVIDERTEDEEIPPIWDLLINRHQSSMDIRLI